MASGELRTLSGKPVTREKGLRSKTSPEETLCVRMSVLSFPSVPLSLPPGTCLSCYGTLREHARHPAGSLSGNPLLCIRERRPSWLQMVCAEPWLGQGFKTLTLIVPFLSFFFFFSSLHILFKKAQVSQHFPFSVCCRHRCPAERTQLLGPHAGHLRPASLGLQQRL